jgi:hypothetical protein|tara:strand:- start:6848 stop:7153 length:306 start_codon:yes stop_codon:yes gene_type:complete
MDRRKFVTTMTIAAALPSFAVASFDSFNIEESIDTAMEHDRFLVVHKGQKLQFGDCHLDLWNNVVVMPGADIRIDDEIYRVTQSPINHNDNVKFVPVYKIK